MRFPEAFQAFTGALPFVFWAALTAGRMFRGTDLPRALIDGFVTLALISDLASEALGHFGKIGFAPLLAIWAAATAMSLVWAWRGRIGWHGGLAFENSLGLYVVGLFMAVTLFIALTAAPNNWDSQTYHLPRIEHWLQDGSLVFYPTSIDRQNLFGPIAELILLQTRALSGGDFYYLLPQWLSMATCVAASYRIAGQLGAIPAQRWIAAVFVATLPIGILESTSTQNDYVQAALLAGFVSLGIEAIDRPRASLLLIVWAGCAGALAGLTKPIAFMLGCGFAVWFAIGLAREARLTTVLGRLFAAAAVLAVIVGPFSVRFAASDALPSAESIEPPKSFGPAQTLDTLIRQIGTEFATGLPVIDAITTRAADVVTSHLGLQAHRVDTTDDYHSYAPPRGTQVFHEDTGPNPIHSALLILALVALVLRWPRAPTRQQAIYCVAWLVGLLAFSTLIRFSNWQVRYHVSGFILAAPIVALSAPVRAMNRWRATALVVLLTVAGLPPLLLNKSREIVPLLHAQLPRLKNSQVSYLTQTPLERLLTNRPTTAGAYRAAIDTIERSGATQIGLVLGSDSWEYPVWWMLRQQEGVRALRVEHVLTSGKETWALGPFAPDVIFWDRGEAEVPAAITVGGLSFNRTEAQSDGSGGRSRSSRETARHEGGDRKCQTHLNRGNQGIVTGVPRSQAIHLKVEGSSCVGC